MILVTMFRDNGGYYDYDELSMYSEELPQVGDTVSIDGDTHKVVSREFYIGANSDGGSITTYNIYIKREGDDE